jgi:hypothetical protein
MLLEIRAVNFVYRLEIAKIGEEDGCFNDIIEAESFGSQNRCDVFQRSAGLRGNVAGYNFARFGVQRNLAAAKKEFSAAHRLRVGADCRRRFIRGNDFLHVGDCNYKSKPHNQCSVVSRTIGYSRIPSELNVGRWMLSVGRFLLK